MPDKYPVQPNNFKFVSDLSQNYCLSKMLDSEPLMPQDYIMDITEEQRFANGTYPRYQKMFEAKTQLIKKRNHMPMVHTTVSMRKVDLM